MPPHALRYETPPTTQPAPQSRPIEQTPLHRADENPSGAPTAHSRYRAATPPPPNNRQSLHRNGDQTAALPSPRRAHAPTAQTALPTATQPRAVHAAPEPRSHPQAYESLRHGAAHSRRRDTERNVWRARHATITCGLRSAPWAPVRWRSRPRRSLRFALRPPPHQPVYDQSEPTPQGTSRPRGPTTTQSSPRSSPPQRAPVGSRRANAHTPAPDQRCENFLYCY
ncbi:hypothetical protein BN000_03743 [Mycobacterium europaeum]|uniref:Uncharacterized protein n=1 Tax=Mycobacterium europaeum TaxID=761804 RepID=A0A0U1DII2_9MYCO|nr:hypothetical protein BN000_03743 [Mycobacterium europaeum]